MRAQRIGEEEGVFGEEDIMVAEALQNSSSRMSRGPSNSKQAGTQVAVQRVSESIGAGDV
jgi:hypothetical protein